MLVNCIFLKLYYLTVITENAFLDFLCFCSLCQSRYPRMREIAILLFYPKDLLKSQIQDLKKVYNFQTTLSPVNS